jgi:hypothetical protein
VGSRSEIDLAYIAGFLDGDGSLMLQLKKRKDGKTKSRFMITICFYQDSRHKDDLYWIRSVLNIGYIFHRNDGMSELRINGYKTAQLILAKLIPYIRFKRIQATALLKAAKLLVAKPLAKLTEKDVKSLVDYMLEIQSANYVTKHKRSKEELYQFLGLTP